LIRNAYSSRILSENCAEVFFINIILLEPEIPQNTGAVARTCACTGSTLHLIEPFGFDISESAVKRAGLDYWHLVNLKVYKNIEQYFDLNGDKKLYFASTKAPHSYTEASYDEDVSIMFGKETKGLPETLLEKYYDSCIRIPMLTEARSLNLSNSVAVIIYEALRQNNFKNLKKFGSMKMEGRL